MKIVLNLTGSTRSSSNMFSYLRKKNSHSKYLRQLNFLIIQDLSKKHLISIEMNESETIQQKSSVTRLLQDLNQKAEKETFTVSIL